MPSLLDRLFPSSNPAPTPAPVPAALNGSGEQTTPTPGTQHSQQTAPNGMVPKGAGDPPSPLQQHKDLWEDPKIDDKNKDEPANAPLDPKKIMEAASKVDFSQVLDKDILAKVAAGGDDAVQALLQSLNRTSQVVYGQATIAANRMIEDQLAKAEERFAARIPGVIKQHTSRENLLSDNPAFQNPVVKPIVESIQKQLVLKYPQASSAELNKMAKEILADAAGVFNPELAARSKAGSDNKKNAEPEIDWSEYLPSNPYN